MIILTDNLSGKKVDKIITNCQLKLTLVRRIVFIKECNKIQITFDNFLHLDQKCRKFLFFEHFFNFSHNFCVE